MAKSQKKDVQQIRRLHWRSGFGECNIVGCCGSKGKGGGQCVPCISLIICFLKFWIEEKKKGVCLLGRGEKVCYADFRASMHESNW